jgi:uncharacterized membrane protein SirB2
MPPSNPETLPVDYLFALLLFSHLLGLMLIATAFFALLGMMGEGTAPATSRWLNLLGHSGIVLALVTGPLMVWQRYGSYADMPHWFWAKMGLIVLLAAGVVLSAVSARKMRAGDAAAAKRVRLGRIIASASLVLTVLFAVLAFG